MKIKFTSFFVLAFLFMCIGPAKNVQAQNEVEMKPLPERIDAVTKKLQLKLILSAEQSSKIDSILIGSIPKNISKENREEIIKLSEDSYKVYLKKQATGNKANIELLKFLKKYFSLSPELSGLFYYRISIFTYND